MRHVGIDVVPAPDEFDDAVLRRLRFPAGEEGEGAAPDRWVFTQTADHDFYYVSDVQFSVRAMVPTGAKQPVAERVRSEAYGQASHWHGFDANLDGYVDSDDVSVVSSQVTAKIDDGLPYFPDLDFNRSGEIDWDDLDLAYAWEYEGRGSAVNHGITDSTRPWETSLIPGPDNPVGYCGYVHVKESGLYAVRFRWYDPATGRWLQRDPAGYQDGPHLFQYGRSAATRYVDYIGKQPVDPPPAPPDPSEDIHLAENDKSNGCGIKVYQADVGNGYGHRWLVIPDPGRGKPGDIDYRPRKNVLAGRQPIGWQTPYSPDPQCCADDAPSPGGADTEWIVAPIPYWAFVATPDAKHVKLEHGPSKGTLFEEATCEQIRQCLLYRITNEHYNYIGIPGENCRNGASNALMECGMGLTNKRRTAQGLAKDEAARAAFYRAMERLGEQRRPRW